jgi:RNA polymerase sigma-70 factor (ECF subfamily)
MPHPLADTPDEMLIRLAQTGQTAAFGQLYERHMDSIYKYFFYRLKEEHEAEDLTENVFVKAWQALPNYEQTEVPFLAWLYRIAHNLLMDYHRRHSLHQRSLPRLFHESSLVDTDELDQIMVQGEHETELIAAVQLLDPVQQDVLLLRFVQGLEHEEVARILNRTAGAVRVIQHRALKALREKLASQ